jgi:hypothetical protein
MVKTFAILTLSLAIWPYASLAQEGHRGTAQQQRAYQSDVARYCRGGQSDAAIADCLRSHAERLRRACRQVIEGNG